MDKRILKQLVRNMVFAVNPMCCGAVAAVPETKQVIGEKKFVTKTIKVGDFTINYNISQRRHKKTLILQHGAFMNNLTMMGLASLFKGYNVIVPDMAGHGKSVSPYPIEDVEQLADIEYNFILKLKETGEILSDADITYAGWSLGGSIGQEMALKEQIFDRLVLISSSPIWNTIPSIPADQFVGAFKEMLADGISKDVSPEKNEWINNNFENMLAPVSVSMNDIVACQKFNVIDKLKEISMPALLISGAKDSLALPECQLTLAEDLQNVKLVLIGNEVHGMVLGCPEKVYTEMIKFIELN